MFAKCMTRESLIGKIPAAQLKKDAAVYEKRGMDANAAMIRAVEDKLSMLALEEKKIIQAVRSAYEADGGTPAAPVKQESSAVTAKSSRVAAMEAAIAGDTFGHDVDVFATMADIPQHIRAQAKKEGATDVEGFFDPRTNRVGLVAENIATPERAKEVARHELIGHFGLENMVGQAEMANLAKRVMQAEKDGNKAIAEIAKQVDKTQPGLPAERRAKEIMAVMAERNMQNSITKRIIDAIRTFLKKAGFIKSDITDAEIAQLLRASQLYLRKAGRGSIMQPAAAFSRSESGDDYRIEHRAPDRDAGAPLHDLTMIYPDDIYGAKAAQYYGHFGGGSKLDADTARKIRSYQNEPDAPIKIYRAIPADIDAEINQYDWVTINRDYAVDHGERQLGGEYKIIEKMVKASDIYTNGDSIHEWGYDPSEEAQMSRSGQATPDQADLNLQQPKKPPSNKDVAGRWKFAAGQKAYDKLGEAINPILAKVALADDAPPAFKQMMRQFQADQSKALANAKSVAEAGMATLTPAERVLISDIIEKNTAIGDLPPEHVAKLATDISAALKQQSQDLIDLGMASEDRLIENYLPRAYRNPLLARITSKEQFVSWYQKAKLRMNGNRLKSRGLVNKVEQKDIDKFKKLGWKISAMADGEAIPADLLDALDNGTKLPPQYTKNVQVLMWRDFTADERAKMGEIRDGILRYAMGYTDTQRDIAIGRLFKAIADNDETSSKINPGGWTKVPDQDIPGTKLKRYGALSGLYVPPYIRDVIERSTQPKGPLMQMYDKALGFWKEGKTVWNPVSHGNNVVSNVFTAYFAGINLANPLNFRKHWIGTVKEYRTKGTYYQEAVDHGLFGNEFASKDIQELFMPELIGDLDAETIVASRMNKVVDALKKTGKPVAWYRDRMQKAYEFEDQFFKLMLFADRRRNGASIEDAITDTERYIFNYADVPKGVDWIKRTYSPFFSYTYKALPMVVHTAMTRPDRLLWPMALLGGANWLAYAITGADEEDERENMPDYMKGRTAIGTPKAVRMPWNDDADRPTFLDMSRRVPLGDLFDMHNQTGGMAAPAPFMPSHPLFTAAAAIILNKDTFTGKDVVKGTDTGWEAAEKRAEWAWKQMAPNAPFVPGTWNFDKLMNGAANAFETEMFGYTGYTKGGDAVPLGRALLDVGGGTKLRSFDPEKNKDYDKFAANKERREIRAEIRSAERNKAMGSAAKAKFIAEQEQKLARIGKEED